MNASIVEAIRMPSDMCVIETCIAFAADILCHSDA
jgi:hypothetical protein